jgi:hypothetical protein
VPDILGWWQRRRWQRARPWVWAAAIAVMAGGLWRVETTARTAHEAVDRVEASERLDDARACLNAWEGRLGVRALFEAIVTAAQNVDPEVLASFRDDVAHRLPDPDCDLAEAQRVLAERPLREE